VRAFDSRPSHIWTFCLGGATVAEATLLWSVERWLTTLLPCCDCVLPTFYNIVYTVADIYYNPLPLLHCYFPSHTLLFCCCILPPPLYIAEPFPVTTTHCLTLFIDFTLQRCCCCYSIDDDWAVLRTVPLLLVALRWHVGYVV